MSLALRSARAVRADTRLRRVRVRSRRQWAPALRGMGNGLGAFIYLMVRPNKYADNNEVKLDTSRI